MKAKLFGILSLVLTSYLLQGCIFVPDRGGPRYYPEEHYHDDYQHGRHW